MHRASPVASDPTEFVQQGRWNRKRNTWHLWGRFPRVPRPARPVNHRITEWLGLEGTSRIIKLRPSPPQAGLPTSTSNTSPGCPGPHPTRPWTPPGMGHPQPLWAAVPAPHHCLGKELPPESAWNFMWPLNSSSWDGEPSHHPSDRGRDGCISGWPHSAFTHRWPPPELCRWQKWNWVSTRGVCTPAWPAITLGKAG